MNKFERQGHHPADIKTLPETTAGDRTPLPGEVIELSDAPPIAPQVPLTQSEVRTILMSLLLTMFLAALDQTIVATALPTIGRQFNDVSSLSWVISAYLLASTAVAPVFGTLSDIYGRRAMIIVSLSLFVAGSVLCALAPNMPVLILARGLQGLGGGGIMPIVQTVISDVVSPRERGQYQAYFSGVWVVGGIGGPILGGVFAEHLHWSMIFWINVPLALGALALLLPKMGKIPVFHRRRKVDWLGGVLLMASAVVIMLVLTWGGNRYLWLSPVIMAMIGASIALAFAFVWHARNADEPFLPLPLMGGTVVPYAMAAGSCAMGAMLGLTVHLPLYYEVVYHLSASEAGLGADSAGGGFDRRRRDRGQDHGPRQTLQAGGHRRHRMRGAGGSGAHAGGDAVMGPAGAAVGVRARARHGISGQRGVGAEFGDAVPGRHRHRRDEFLSRADGVFHGGRIQRDPADGARRRHLARRRASRSGEFDCRRRHGHGVPLRVRRRHGTDRHLTAVHDPDGRKAAGRPGHDPGRPGRVGFAEQVDGAGRSHGPSARASATAIHRLEIHLPAAAAIRHGTRQELVMSKATIEQTKMGTEGIAFCIARTLIERDPSLKAPMRANLRKMWELLEEREDHAAADMVDSMIKALNDPAFFKP